jgi:hypothetical protein
MAIAPTCDLCGAELTAFGAILLSPPKGRAAEKLHACAGCWKKITPMVRPARSLRKPRR